MVAEVDVLLGHPLDDVLGARVLTVDGVVAAQLEVDATCADRHLRMVAELVAGLSDGDDESCRAREVVDDVACVQSLGELAPLGELRLGDPFAPEHVHGRGPFK